MPDRKPTRTIDETAQELADLLDFGGNEQSQLRTGALLREHERAIRVDEIKRCLSYIRTWIGDTSESKDLIRSLEIRQRNLS